MGKQSNGLGGVVPGQCITRKPDPDRPGKFIQCTNTRSGSTWYCDECTADWHAHRLAGRTAVTIADDVETKSYGRGSGGRTRIGGGPEVRNDKWNFPGPVAGQGVKLPNVARPACDSGPHDGTAVIYTFADGKTLHGAKGSQINDPDALTPFGLVIDCAGVITAAGKFVKSAPNRRFAALNRAGLPDVLRLDWPDMTAPVHVGREFWRQLLGLLPEHTVICCVGGHGRTGTAAACLLVASGMDPETAIKTVRENHCKRAIETAGQETYIRGLAK